MYGLIHSLLKKPLWGLKQKLCPKQVQRIRCFTLVVVHSPYGILTSLCLKYSITIRQAEGLTQIESWLEVHQMMIAILCRVWGLKQGCKKLQDVMSSISCADSSEIDKILYLFSQLLVEIQLPLTITKSPSNSYKFLLPLFMP